MSNSYGDMMFIKNIIEEGVSSKDKDDIVTECTKLVQVKEAIERMDGVNKTAVVLQLDENNLMIVGGGADNKFVVFAKLGGKDYYMANKFDSKKDFFNITVAKKKHKYPSRRCFGIDTVLESAKHFAHRGTLTQVFTWERV
ncbi:MAG: hypothetical protein ACOX1V_04515 [Candidatus Iainarchaeum sp.]